MNSFAFTILFITLFSVTDAVAYVAWMLHSRSPDWSAAHMLPGAGIFLYATRR